VNESEFAEIFSALKKVENELQQVGANPEKKQRCCDRLLELRKRMDSYVEYWLRFEEKINELQEKYNFMLPDEMPEFFLQSFGTVFSEAKAPEAVSESEKRGIKMLLLQDNDGNSIRSFRRGLGFMELAMMDEAIREFKEVIKEEPDLMLAHLFLGIAYAERGIFDEAMRELRLVQALNKDSKISAIIHNTMGNVYADREQYELAYNEFSKVLEIDPDFAVAYFNLGAVCYNLQRYEESAQAFEMVKEKYPRDWEIYYYLGKIYRKLKDDEQALVNLLKASCLAPREPLVAYELGLLYEDLGETRRALENYYRARKLSQEAKGEEQEAL